MAENLSFSGSGRSRGALQPSREAGGQPSISLDGYQATQGRSDSENDKFSAKSKTTPLLNSRLATADKNLSKAVRQRLVTKSHWSRGPNISCKSAVKYTDIGTKGPPGSPGLDRDINLRQKSSPERPTPRPSRGTQKLPPDCLPGLGSGFCIPEGSLV